LPYGDAFRPDNQRNSSYISFQSGKLKDLRLAAGIGKLFFKYIKSKRHALPA